jgi:MFS family permease
VLAVTVLGSGIVALDATVVSIALPAIGRDFHASVAALQWMMNGYTLTLAAVVMFLSGITFAFIETPALGWLSCRRSRCSASGSRSQSRRSPPPP